MNLKFTNYERTCATFNGASFSLAAPEDWNSIGDGPTREAVLAWLAEGNVPEPMDAPDRNTEILTQIVALEATATPRRMREAALGIDGGWLQALDAQIAALRSQLL